MANINPPLLALFFLVSIGSCVYVPELLLSATAKFFNSELSKYGPKIDDLIQNNLTIPDISYDDTFQGVHVEFNLTDFKKKASINWEANVLNVQDAHSFVVMSKNINLTIDSNIEFRIAGAIRQKGVLNIKMQKLETDTTLQFTQPKCKNGIGFDLQIAALFVHTDNITINIEGKTVDNLVIRAVMSVLKSRLPKIIENVAINQVNPIITNYTCIGVKQQVNIGQCSYVLTANTTEVPHFTADELYFLIDLTFENMVSNATNPEVENDNLPEKNIFTGLANATVALSSNMLNTILWVIDDSKLISKNVTNADLGPDPPIALNTLNLSILIPAMRRWGSREVILLIETSNRFSHLYIRNGKILTALSLSIKFVVNETGSGSDVKQCLAKKECVVACDLNATLPLSAAVHVDSGAILKGLIHSISIQNLKPISSMIDINIANLKKILNTMVGSFRPQINKSLQEGMALNISALEKFGISDLALQVKKDHAFMGLVF